MKVSDFTKSSIEPMDLFNRLADRTRHKQIVLQLKHLSDYTDAMKENFENANTLSDFLSKEKELRAVVIKKHRKKYPTDVSKLEEKINDQKTTFKKDFWRKQTGQILIKQQHVVNEYNNTMKNCVKKISEKKLEALHKEAAKKAEEELKALPCFEEDPDLWKKTQQQLAANLSALRESFIQQNQLFDVDRKHKQIVLQLKHLSDYTDAMKENFENANTLSDFLSKEKELRADVIEKHRKQYPTDVSKLEEKINDQRATFETDFLRKQTSQIQAKQQHVVNEYNNTMKNCFNKISEKKLEALHKEAAKKAEEELKALPCFAEYPGVWKKTQQQLAANLSALWESFIQQNQLFDVDRKHKQIVLQLKHLSDYTDAMKENFENANTLSDFLSKEKELRADVIEKHRKQYPDDIGKLEEKINDQKTVFEKDFFRKQTGQILTKQRHVVNEYNNTMKNRFDKINEKKLDHLHNDAAKKAEEELKALPCFAKDPDLWKKTQQQLAANLSGLRKSFIQQNQLLFANHNNVGEYKDQGYIMSWEILVDMTKDHKGQGGFGTVRVGFINFLGTVAIKVPKLHGSHIETKADEEKFIKEIQILQHANHENIVRIFGFTRWNQSIAMIMEYMPGTDLNTLLLCKNAGDIFLAPDLPETLCLRFCHDISSGVAYLHYAFFDQRIVHGDLKPRNVLLTSDLRCKIGDFGGADIATCTDGVDSETNMIRRKNEHTEGFTAPERLKNPHLRVSKAADVYSVGMIFYIVIRRQKILRDVNQSKNEVIRYCQFPSKPLHAKLKKIIPRCIDWVDENRPTMLEMRDILHTSLRNEDTTCVAQMVANVLKTYKFKSFIDSAKFVALDDVSVDHFIG